MRLRLSHHPEARMVRAAAVSLGCNCLYALYHGVLGLVHLSLWSLSLGAFYAILAVARFCALLSGRTRAGETATASGGFVMAASGALLLLLSVVLAGVLAISLSQHIATAYDTVTMITIATYTFYKITVAVVNRVRRPGTSALSRVIRNIRYAEVAASVLTLQRSMLASFGTPEETPADWMNALTGAAVCLFILSLGIYLMLHARKEDSSWQNQNL